MKKLLCMILVLAVCLPVLACAKQEIEAAETESTTQEVTEAITQKEDPVKTVMQSYLSPTLTQTLLDSFSAERAIIVSNPKNGYVAMQDLNALVGKKLVTLGIPVAKALQADADGNFTLTVGVFRSTEEGMKQAPIRTYPLKISASAFGLKENTASTKWIALDVADVEITVAEGETVAFGAPTDTLLLACLADVDTPLRRKLADEKPMIMGSLSAVGTASCAPSTLTLPFSFSFSYTGPQSTLPTEKWERDVEYEELVEEFKKQYAGKYVSILGDSISTWLGTSDNAATQATLAGNGSYYGEHNGRLTAMDTTWWGRLIRDTEMQLCVNNSCSGASVYGVAGGKQNHEISAIERCTSLHTKDGKQPDLILFYMGTNDPNKPSGDLYNLLKNSIGKDRKEVVGAWFEGVLKATNNGTDCRVGATYTTFDQAYALTIWKMKQTYANADVLCMSLMLNKAWQADKVSQYNICIQAIAEYFGGTYLDLYGQTDMSQTNMHAYTVDANLIHPNAAGHYQITKALLSKLLAKK